MGDILKLVKRIAIVLGVGLTLFAVLETLRAYETLRELNPWAGYGFLAFVALLILYLIWQVRALFSYRTALAPPALSDDIPVSQRQISDTLHYLDRVTVRLEMNPLLQNGAPGGLNELRFEVDRLLASRTKPENIREELQRVENEKIAPLLKLLDVEAERIISDNVGLVTIGTALSPYRSVDLYIVLARNLRMINRILYVYRTRPVLRETLRVFYDITKVVAAVNLLNAMDNIWAGLARYMPKVGVFAEAFSEGLFSGLLTSVAGHAAIDRCRSYRPWSGEEAVRRYRGRLHRWARDVIGILIHHGFDKIIPKRGKRETEGSGTSGSDDTMPAKHSRNIWSLLSFKRKK
ncbi:MAG: YcjF family protein [bacterium]